MNENKAIASEYAEDFSNLDELEAKLSNDLEGQLSGLEFLEKEREKIGNPEGLGATIESAIWEQFRLQIGYVAGEDFISENRGNTLDLRDEAHIQTSENFKEGKIATHNYHSKEQLEQNYDRYKNTTHKEFRKEYVDPGMDETLERAGSLYNKGKETVKDIYTGRQIPTKTKLEDGKNNPNAAQREHVKPSAEVYKNESLQMAYGNEELAEVINDPENLQGYTTAERNNRKSDSSAEEMHDKDKNKHWEKANKRAEEHIEKKEKEGKERLEREGRQTQKEEALRIGGKALRAVLLGLLSEFLRVVIKKLVSWFKNAERKWSTFVDQFKEAWKEFWANLKTHLVNVGKVLLSTIMTAIFGPIVSVFTKLWTVLKTGWSSLLQAISYIRNPENRTKPFSVLMLEAGKIIVAGLSGIGALVLGEVIEKGLISAGLVIQIPLLGSLASIIGLFVGAIVSGIVGALVLRWIDKLIVNRLKSDNGKQQIEKQKEILATQEKLMAVVETKVENIKETVAQSIIERHDRARKIMEEAADRINKVDDTINRTDVAINETNYVIGRTEDTINRVSAIMNDKNGKMNMKSENDNDLENLFKDLNNL
ncbi:cation diffusion facilitator family transporter [Capnocytophaga gingivalis]|uniref:cation diffusion facilitator family transporter n=1 Tax=Capnocytophaga gingivalis TaxID=1017 RepID=UPI0028E26017|nr:cation diffusion facilitator family transporter [Capnocytophaga gingivalis]